MKVTSLKELNEAVNAENMDLDLDLVSISKEAEALQEKLAQIDSNSLEIEAKIKEAEAKQAELLAQNETLAESLEANKAALKKAEENNEASKAAFAELEEANKKLAKSNEQIAQLKVENELEKGLAGLTFDANDSKRNARMAELCKADWKAQYKVAEREETLVMIDKKTQSDIEGTISEHIREFAVSNAYTVKVATGLNIASELKETEASVTDISPEDKNSDDPKRREAYQAKKAELDKAFAEKGGVLNSSKHRKMLIENGLLEKA